MTRFPSSLLLLSLAVGLAGSAGLAAPRVYQAAPVRGTATGAPSSPRAPSDPEARYAPVADPSPPLRLAPWQRSGTPLSGSVAAFSPDGKLLATGNAREGAVCLWETRGGSPRVLLAPSRDRREKVTALAFSADGRRLAAVMARGGGYLWHTATDRAPAALPEACAPIAFSPDGTLLATSTPQRDGSAGGSIVLLWHGRTGASAARLRGDGMPANEIAFSPDGRLLATAHSTRSTDAWASVVYLWDGHTGKPRQTLVGHRGPLAFTPDGRRLWAGTAPLALEEPALGRASERPPWPGEGSDWVVTAAPGGRCALFLGRGPWPEVADLEAGAVRGMLRRTLPITRGQIFLAALLVAAVLMGVPLLVGRIGRRCTGRHPAVVALAGVGGCLVSPFVAVALALAVLWPFRGVEAERCLQAAALSPDGRHVAVADGAGKVRIWRTGDCRREAVVTIRPRVPGQVLFSPDGTLLMAADDRANVHLWRVRR